MLLERCKTALSSIRWASLFIKEKSKYIPSQLFIHVISWIDIKNTNILFYISNFFNLKKKKKTCQCDNPFSKVHSSLLDMRLERSWNRLFQVSYLYIIAPIIFFLEPEITTTFETTPSKPMKTPENTTYKMLDPKTVKFRQFLSGRRFSRQNISNFYPDWPQAS